MWAFQGKPLIALDKITMVEKVQKSKAEWQEQLKIGRAHV